MYQVQKFTSVFLFKLLLLIIFLLTGLSTNAQVRLFSFNFSNGDKTSIKYSKTGFDKFSLSYEGEITLSEDDKDIVAITDGGYIKIKKSVFGNKRKVVIESEGNGQLIKKYYVGRSQIDFEPEGRKWLSEILPNIVRSTNVGLKGRVERIYNQGGAKAIFDEVEVLESDYLASKYLKMILQKDLANEELESLLEVASEKISSDYRLAELLEDYQQDFFTSDAVLSAYIKAAKCIGSDYHMSKVLNVLLDEDLNSKGLGELLQLTNETISSDYHLAEVLTRAIRRQPLDENNLPILLESLSTISSDYHAASVVSQLAKEDLSDKQLIITLEALDGINSDYHLSSALQDLAPLVKRAGEDTKQAYLKACKSISSDSRFRVILAR